MLLEQMHSNNEPNPARSNAGACGSVEVAALPLDGGNLTGSLEQESPAALLFGGMPGLFSDLVLQSMEDPVVLIGQDLRILWANGASKRCEAIGKTCYEEVRKRKAPCAGCPVEAAFGSGRSGVAEKWFPLANGSGRWFEVRTYPVSDQSGKIVCAFKISFDVTQRRRALEKQRKYIETLEKTVRQIERDLPGTHSQPGVCPTDFHPRLSRRETEVLRFVTEGFTNSEISQMLSMSAHTVKSHVIHIFNKLGVTDRTQAAVQAIRLGLI